MSTKKQQPDLVFGPGPSDGFGALAEQSGLRPVVIVRELVQNALDAARDARREKAIIRFEISKEKIKNIPGLSAYKTAFSKAKKSWEELHDGTLPDSAKSITDAIEKRINSKEVVVLSVMDNGIGFDEKRMAAILVNGVSQKSTAGAGSYGYGHTVVIPASDMRYILYGGLCGNERIAAGHAVLASFQAGNKINGGDGYFVTGTTGKMKSRYIFPKGRHIPDIINSKLDTIAHADEWGDSGSVVVIPAFKFFNDDAGICEEILKAVACNFFVAVHRGELEVEYKDSTLAKSLNKSKLSNVLGKYKDERRARHFLNGHKAYKAYEALKKGKFYDVPTSMGPVKINLYSLNSGDNESNTTQINLCRNGIHITDAVPQLGRSDFTDYVPFHCIVLVDANDGEFHRLVRKAEPPKHNELSFKDLLTKEERGKLKAVFNTVKEFIKGEIKKIDAEEYRVTDVLNIKSTGINNVEELPPRVRIGGNDTTGKNGKTGKNGGDSAGRTDTGKSTGSGSFRKEGRAVSFHATPVVTGKRSYVVQVELDENSGSNEIRFALDESIDSTCDSMGEDHVQLFNITIDGNAAAKESLVRNDEGHVLGVNLGSGKERKQVEISFDFATSDIADSTPVTLQAELVRRKAERG